MMSLTEMQIAHDKIHPTLQRWAGVIEACHRWIDGDVMKTVLRSETSSKNVVLDTLVRMTQFESLTTMSESFLPTLANLLTNILRCL